MRMPRPRARNLPISRCRSCTAMGSTPANGSSKSMNCGPASSDRAISVRRLSPPLSVSPSESATRKRSNSVSSSSARSSCALRASPEPSSTSRKFCRTVSLRKMDGSCGREPIADEHVAAVVEARVAGEGDDSLARLVVGALAGGVAIALAQVDPAAKLEEGELAVLVVERIHPRALDDQVFAVDDDVAVEVRH